VNHSSKRSAYFVELSLQSGDGATQYNTTMAVVSKLEPGQTAQKEIRFFSASTAGADAKAVVKSVQRTASF
jgi:hypothetical protein